jgi:hypothetical protein
MSEDVSRVPVRELILVPSIVTLGVTLLRLAGELQNWSPTLFNKTAGGGGALVGISWLILVFGFYFGWRLTKAGDGPESAGKVVGLAFVVALVVVGVSAAFGRISQNAFFLAFTVGSIVGVVVTARLWPALWKTLLAYAFAARIPVAIVMLLAILGNWGTHYDVAPPDFPEMAPVVRWLMIGLLPQMTLWIFMTVVGGLLFGGIAAAIARRRS